MQQIHFHKRNLPHIYVPGQVYFITYRLKDSIPISILNELKNKYYHNTEKFSIGDKYNRDKIFFAKYDTILNSGNIGQQLLNDKCLSQIVSASIKYYDMKDFELFCYTIMPNHVHILFKLLEASRTIDKIMQSIKRYSAQQINIYLNKKGRIWQAENYDHIVRSEEELYNIINYIIFNPVKAHLVSDWKQWEFTFLSDKFRSSDF